MAKIELINKYPLENDSGNGLDTFLDTLELTAESQQSKTLKALANKAIRKHQTNVKLVQIIDVLELKKNADNSEIKKYWKAYHCANVFLKIGNRIHTERCKQRFCQNCARIQAADITNGYKTPLENLRNEDSLYMVTLTRPNVKGRELSNEIKKMIKTFQKIKDSLRKAKTPLNGFRKLECTYNQKETTYNPHFHILVQGQTTAESLLSSWLKQNPRATMKAQKISLIDSDDYMREIAKYAAKDPVSNEATAEAALVMYKSMQGKRIYQPFGTIRKVKIQETAKEISTTFEAPELNENDTFVWTPESKTWTAANYQELVNTMEYEASLLEPKNRLKTDVKQP
jgi:plasmid rolling circle replication initiator protein Rep